MLISSIILPKVTRNKIQNTIISRFTQAINVAKQRSYDDSGVLALVY